MSTLTLLTYVFLHENIAITCIYPILNNLSYSTSHTFKTGRSPQITRERNKQKVILIITSHPFHHLLQKGEHRIYLDARLFNYTAFSLSVTTGLSQHSVFVKPGIESALKTGSFPCFFCLT